MGGVGVVEWGGDHKWIAELSGIKRKTRRTEGFLRTVGKQAFMDDMAYVPFPFLATVFLQPWVVFVVLCSIEKRSVGIRSMTQEFAVSLFLKNGSQFKKKL